VPRQPAWDGGAGSAPRIAQKDRHAVGGLDADEYVRGIRRQRVATFLVSVERGLRVYRRRPRAERPRREFASRWRAANGRGKV
jgi:hypothetical protein